MRATAILALGAVLLLLLAGCASSPTPTHHSLVVPVGAVAAKPAGSTPAGVPVTIVIVGCAVPAAVDRPQLVVSDTSGAVRIVATERWIEPLREAVPRALAGVLAEGIAGAIVWRGSGHAPSRPNVSIALEITEWTSVPGTSAAVSVAWQLRRGSHTIAGQARAQMRPIGTGYAELVAAHRDALHAVGLDLAREVAVLLREPQQH